MGFVEETVICESQRTLCQMRSVCHLLGFVGWRSVLWSFVLVAIAFKLGVIVTVQRDKAQAVFILCTLQRQECPM